MVRFARCLAITAVLSAIFTTAAFAQAAQPPAREVPPAAPCGQTVSPRPYVFDASSGSVTGDKRYKTGDKLEVFVKNLNPFRYSYTLTAKDAVVAGPSGADLLAHITVAAAAKGAAVVPSTGAAAPLAGLTEFETLTVRSQGVDAKNRLLALQDKGLMAVTVSEEEVELEAAGIRAVRAVMQSEEAIRGLGASVATEQAALAQASATCEALVLAARRLAAAAAETDPALDTAADEIDAYRAARRAASGIDNVTPLETADLELPTLDERLRDARETYAKLAGVVQGVERIASGSAFYRLIHTGDFDEPTDVAVTFARKDDTDPKAKSETMHEVRLNFGGRNRFTTSGGWAVSSLGRQTYARVQGHARASGDAEADLSSLASVVGYTEDSDQRNGPIAMVHVRIKDWLTKPVSLHWSLGATPKSNDDQLTVEYLTGPSLGLAEDRFFMTVGAYFGRQESLANGWFLGEAVPEDVAAVPVTRNLKVSWGIALTYKLR